MRTVLLAMRADVTVSRQLHQAADASSFSVVSHPRFKPARIQQLSMQLIVWHLGKSWADVEVSGPVFE